MIIRTSLLAACLMALSARAEASPPLAPETVAAIGAAFSDCTGGYQRVGEWRLIGAKDLAPSIASLGRPSTELDSKAAEDLYLIAKAFLVPSVDVPDWITDPTSFFKCSARPADAVAIMEFLVGEEPGDLRSNSGTFPWLGLVHERGVVGVPDAEKARRYYLVSRMYSPFPVGERWSDGIDTDLIGNIERAGLRSYFDQLTEKPIGDAARMLLADEVLETDPARARTLLKSDYLPALRRLIELEDQGLVPTAFDPADIAFWAEQWRTNLNFDKWAARLLRGASLANGGVIPTASTRPSIDDLRPYLDTAIVADAWALRGPLPMRALVDPQGRAIYVEACRDNNRPFAPRTSIDQTGVRLDAMRLYNLAGLPKLAPPTIDGRPAYGWVILPAVHFQGLKRDKLEIAFADLPAESCVYSDMLPTWPGATPPAF